MLHEIFYWLLNMSIGASLVGMIVLLLRQIKRLPRRIVAFLWLAPFLRMCIPSGMDNAYSLMSLLSRFWGKSVAVYNSVPGSIGIAFSSMNHLQAAESYFPLTYKKPIFEEFFSVAAVVWLAVFLVLAFALLLLYFKTLLEMKGGVRLEKNVFLSNKVAIPAVYGVFRAKIVLPAAYRETDNRFVLLHEQAHIRRGDNLWRILGFFIAAAHWFNPLAWIFLKLFLGDLELACDEKVIAKLNGDEVKAYAHTIFDCRERNTGLTSAFGGAKIKRRIENIVSFRKMTGLSVIGFTALLVAILTVLLTNAPGT